MDNHPIETWDKLVHSMLHPSLLLKSASQAMDGYLVKAKELKEALRMQLLRDNTEKEIEVLVERHQIKVAGLLNLLFHYQQDELITPGLKKFFEAVAEELAAILNGIWISPFRFGFGKPTK
jgi:hypothetical protein